MARLPVPGLLLSISLLPSALGAQQEAPCPKGPADAERTVELTVGRPYEATVAATDSLMAVLGYTREGPPTPQVYYSAAPRLGWPLGADKAPWHGDDQPPGYRLSLTMHAQGDSTVVEVTTRPLCAIQSTKKSRSEKAPEHMLAIFAGMQVITALSGHLDTALHPYD